ncbi:MAG: alpha-L-rhamnosidase N-terminal domain-containing protein [Christensenellales bacterium]
MDFDFTFRAASGRFTTWEESTPAPYVRGSFRLCGAKTVTVTVTGLGFYDLFINGKRLTKGICAPYISNPDKEIFFDRYDISKDVTDGENVIGLILGNGFFNAWDGFVWDFDKAGYRGAPMTAFVIEADGKPVFSSADRLTVHDSPVLATDFAKAKLTTLPAK